MIDQVVEFITGDQKIYWAFALFGSFIFTIQLILFFFGVGQGGGDVDIDGDGIIDSGGDIDSGMADFRVFSIRSIVAFITFFGWGGVVWGENGVGSLLFALGSGLLMMFATATLLYLMLKMQHSGNINVAEFIGQTGTVYLGIPAGKSGTGKVTVTIKGCTREIRAIAEEEIKTGTTVKVLEHIDAQCYLVTPV